MNQSGFHGMGAETSEQKYMSNEKTPWLFRGLSLPFVRGFISHYPMGSIYDIYLPTFIP